MSDFTNTAKAYDRARPMHRINSPVYSETQKPASGNGKGCGCRDDTDYKILPGIGEVNIAAGRRVMRTVPDWVPVDRDAKDGNPPTPAVPREQWPTLPEKEYELEGVVTESRIAGSDVQWTQWHLWFDWNFLVIPAKGYEYVRGVGNPDETVECEWDMGAFGDYDFKSSRPTASVPGPMFGPDWAWPVGGENIWVSGRWIYDCGHADQAIQTASGEWLVGDLQETESPDQFIVNTKNGPVVVDAPFKRIEKSVVKTELHPCKAVASARWEAFHFKENERHVPAIQFMFFACSSGGYISPFALNPVDYEFIVDLPENDEIRVPYPVGHTQDFPLNTIVMRGPRLLTDFNYEPFANAAAPVGRVEPVIEILPGEGDKPPTQVKVRIPLTTLGSDIHSYGVIASFGWYDPHRILAKKIKRVEVYFNYIEVGEIFDQDFEPALVRELHLKGFQYEWHMKVGVNGKWLAVTKTIDASGQRILFQNQPVTLYLAEDDLITITAHGVTPGVNFDLMSRANDERKVANWAWSDIDTPSDHQATLVANDVVELAIEILLKEQQLAQHENFGRAVILPNEPGEDANDAPNPLKVSDLIQKTGGPGNPLECQLTGSRESDDAVDYVLNYQITYWDLPD